MENGFSRKLLKYLLKTGMGENIASYLNVIILFVGILLLSWLFHLIIWKVLRAIAISLAERSNTSFDNFIVTHRVPRYVAYVFPLILLYYFLPVVFMDFGYGRIITLKILQILFVVLTLVVVKRLFRCTKDYLKTKPKFRDKPIDSYIQVFIFFAGIIGIMIIFGIITGVEVWKFFTVLGTGSAIIILIFKDSILGLVASIQVSINNMVSIGDWITFDKYGADGYVTEINLSTVKVQNFDMTITTIPTYALISDSFKNWRGMQDSGGRRIKRALIISQKSIRFLSEEDVTELKKIQLITTYLTNQTYEIHLYNSQQKADKSSMVNGRNLTNFGVFRKYISSYLEKHSAINKTMTMMVRQLEPTSQGIPLEIYAFSADKKWENYEYIIADIFDHLLAALPSFNLAVFELPTSLEGKKSIVFG